MFTVLIGCFQVSLVFVFRFYLFLLLCLSGGLIKAVTKNDSLTLLSNASQSSTSGIFYRLYLNLV
jgi:hypothetical protein